MIGNKVVLSSWRSCVYGNGARRRLMSIDSYGNSTLASGRSLMQSSWNEIDIYDCLPGGEQIAEVVAALDAAGDMSPQRSYTYQIGRHAVA
jgi:hypothetical protein